MNMSEIYWNKSMVPGKLFPDWSYQTYSRKEITEDLKTLLGCQRHACMYVCTYVCISHMQCPIEVNGILFPWNIPKRNPTSIQARNKYLNILDTAITSWKIWIYS